MPAPFTRPASRTAQGALALLLAMLVSLAPAPSVRAGDPPTTTDPGLAAAGWLAQQIENDPTLGAGTLADAIFAFAAVGAGQSAAGTALAEIEANLDAFVAPGGSLAPGAVAKAMLAVQVQGADLTTFGGRDLESDLRGLLTVGGPDDGRLGVGSVLDQSLAILALSRTAGGVPSTAVTWLSAAQCPSGEYHWDSSCPAAPGSEDPDTTAIAVQALLAGGATTAADAATAWLLSIQQTGGGLPSFGLANTNSTGVGGQALRAAGETVAADAAATFVLSLAFGCEAEPSDVGAIGWAVGIPGFLVFSTPQALLALGAPPLDQLAAAGAMSDAPVLECAVTAPAPSAPAATSTPAPSGEAGELPDTALAGSDAPTWMAIVLLSGTGAGLAMTRRRSRRAAG
jgi:hypothetical protein